MVIIDNGCITSPKGYKASGAACSIKKDNTLDMALVVSKKPSDAIGVFTKNVVKGHSLLQTMSNIKHGVAHAVVINSGNANACIGAKGEEDAHLMAKTTSSMLGCKPEHILLGSTGVIGIPMKSESILTGIDMCIKSLSIDGGHDAAKAIMTTDLVAKEIAVEIMINNTPVRIGAMAKGSGMIHPDMATMIAVLTTDACIDKVLLDEAFRKAVDTSFNKISVDGDTSVCDMTLMLSNGEANNEAINKKNQDYDNFVKALSYVCVFLAKSIASDGEGATKLIEVKVINALTQEDANKVANSIVKSPLVKTTVFGEDANWGRIITATGYSGVSFDPLTVDIYIGSEIVCSNGNAVMFDEDKTKSELSKKQIELKVDLKSGQFASTMWTCDLTYDYIKINGSYRS